MLSTDAHGDGSIEGFSLDSGHYMRCIRLQDCTGDNDRDFLEHTGKIVHFEKDFDTYRRGDEAYIE